MLKVLLPDNHHAERSYITRVLLEEFLGLVISITYSPTSNKTKITLENGRQLYIDDHFFHAFPSPLSYLRQENIPASIARISRSGCPFLPEEDLPVIYGQPSVNAEAETIHCGVDVFASAFFMLTRWEEYVREERDVHGRFPAKVSLAFKGNFLHRPIVNEMTEMLWAMLVHLGIEQQRKSRRFELMLTHDVDYPLLWNSPFDLLRKMGGSLLKRQDPAEAWYYFKNYFATLSDRTKDPFNTFGYLMDLAEQQGLSAHFFFLCKGKHPFDNPHSLPQPFIRELMQELVTRGHHIGFHPSYETFQQPELFQQELHILENLAGQPVRIGRQHFLRFEAPTTWQIWEDNGMDWDSTVYYAEAAGFRCGCCRVFPVFNFLTRKVLALREVPLSAMEVTWLKYLKSSPDAMLGELQSMAQTIRRYNGTMVLLWHNSMFLPEWEAWRGVYKELVEYA